MKFFILIVFAFVSLISKEKKVVVHVTYINNYCGGARPTDEVLEKYAVPQNLSEYEIKLTNIKSKKTILVETDSLGNFSYELKPGKYRLFLTNKINKKLFTNYNPTCTKMLNTSYAELTVEQNKINYEINLFFPCNLCEKNDKP